MKIVPHGPSDVQNIKYEICMYVSQPTQLRYEYDALIFLKHPHITRILYDEGIVMLQIPLGVSLAPRQLSKHSLIAAVKTCAQVKVKRILD